MHLIPRASVTPASATPRRLLTLLALLLCLPLAARSQGLPDFTVLVEQNAPAIVNVSTVRRAALADGEEEALEELLQYFYGDRLPPRPELRGRQPAAVGSGFILSTDGYVVTNHHVVADAEEVTVTLNDRREFPAEVVGSDESSDLALLKIDGQGLPAVKLADPHDLKVGEWVLAIGSPFGLSYSVAAGIVSFIGRNLPSYEGIGNYVSYIQTDVAINPGHSGGPLFNLDGEVVGVNSQIFTNSGGSIGLSFAIPVDVASNVIVQLRDKGEVRRGWMGVAIDNVSPDLAEAFNLGTPHGALINQVLRGSPAADAGFRAGDVIVAFEGHTISSSGDLPYNVGLVAPGTEVAVDVIRDGEPLSISMVVGDLAEADGQIASLEPQGPPDGIGRRPTDPIGLEVRAADEEMLEALGVDQAVVVEAVVGEVARAAEFEEGDVLISLNGIPVDSPEAFDQVAASLPRDRLLPALVARDGRMSFLTLRLRE